MSRYAAVVAPGYGGTSEQPIVQAMARQLEVTFKIFRDAGRELRITRLAHFGEVAERHHDEYSADAKRLLTQMFVERAQSAGETVRSTAEQSRRVS